MVLLDVSEGVLPSTSHTIGSMMTTSNRGRHTLIGGLGHQANGWSETMREPAKTAGGYEQ